MAKRKRALSNRGWVCEQEKRNSTRKRALAGVAEPPRESSDCVMGVGGRASAPKLRKGGGGRGIIYLIAGDKCCLQASV